tara:strand:+ start:115 stop:363 length:249 start_codon:yes stop_codon:yes gene_type:complete
VSEIEEIGAEIGEPDCKLIRPVSLKTTEEKITVEEGKVLLTPWLNSFTKNTTFMISSDKIITLADPGENIIQKYESLVNKNK